MTSTNATLELVRQSVAAVLNVGLLDVQEDSLLRELGADSFQLVDLVCHLESSVRINFPAGFYLTSDHSISSVVRAIEEITARSHTAPSAAESGSRRLLWQ